jgi:hypothetical protein
LEVFEITVFMPRSLSFLFIVAIGLINTEDTLFFT